MSKFPDQSDAVGRALWIAIGVGLLADAYLLCVRTGWLLQSPLALLLPCSALAGLGFICVDAMRSTLRDTRENGRLHPATIPLLAIGGVVLALQTLINLVPPVARDELTYHLAVPALYLRAGHSIDLPFLMHSYYPMLMEMLYIPFLAQLPANAPKFLHLACGAAASALLYLYLATRVRPVVALAASVVLLSTPTVVALGASAYVDLGLFLYTAVAVIGMLRWSETGRPADLIISALGAGCAAGVKYNGLVVLALIGAAVLVLAPRKDRAAPLRAAVAFGVIALLPLLPWLLKNAIDTGNPFFPLFNDFMGGRSLPRAPAVDVFSYRQALYGETWLEILLVPLRVFVTGRDAVPAQFDGVFNPLWLLGVGSLALAASSRREYVMVGFAGVFLLITLSSHVFRSRYVIPILVPLTILTAQWLQAHWETRRTLVTGAIAAALLFNGAHLALFWQRMDPLPYVLGHEERTTYIERFVPEYPVTAYANAHLPPQSTVYLAFLGGRGYYWDHIYTYDEYLSGTRLCEAVRRSTTAADVAEQLRADGITHIAAADPLLADFVRTNLTAPEYERWQAFVSNHLRPLFAQNGVGLYAMVGT